MIRISAEHVKGLSLSAEPLQRLELWRGDRCLGSRVVHSDHELVEVLRAFSVIADASRRDILPDRVRPVDVITEAELIAAITPPEEDAK